MAGRAPELCVRALCPGLVLLLSSGRAGPVSSFCSPLVLLLPLALLLSSCCPLATLKLFGVYAGIITVCSPNTKQVVVPSE